LLHEIERSVISTKAFGYLIQLRELGIIDEVDFEQVLERAMMLGTTKVDVEDIKSIVASFLNHHEILADGSYLYFDEQTTIQ